MKRILIILVMLACLGCGKKVSAPIPGAVNDFDGTSYVTLMDTQAALNAIKDDVATGRYVPTPGAKKVINQAIADYNLGEAAWHAYHSGATHDQVALQAAINQIIVDIVKIADPHVITPQKLQVPQSAIDRQHWIEAAVLENYLSEPSLPIPGGLL